MTVADHLAVAIAGSGGVGALTCGSLLLEAASTAGWYGLLRRTVGPQIRGGEAAALLRLGNRPVECAADRFDLLIGIDWSNVDRFGAEIELAPGSLVISDPRGGEQPAAVAREAARIVDIPMKDIAKGIADARANMIALGIAAKLLGLNQERLAAILDQRLADKGVATINASRAALAAGFRAAADVALERRLAPPAPANKRWLVSGNEITGLGAIRGGVRFAAAYPITPASEILEWLAPNLAKVGGVLLQAEDELASINMIIGASFGGTPAMTATSGPGLSLMVEALGLATAAEIPVVIVDVMRGGPSTGIPTKSEQADLNIAVYGCHGDAPHLVLAPQSIADCLFTTQWAAHLAEALQTPAIVLSDQFLGQSVATIDRPPDIAFVGERRRHPAANAAYKRYALVEEGVAPMAIPGTLGGQYTADGLTHTERGVPTSSAVDHQAQLDRRRDKLERFSFGDHWATLEGEGETAVITWGSLTGSVREAIAGLRQDGSPVRLVAPRLLSPLRPEQLKSALYGVKRLLVVEQSHGAQFHHYLRAHCDLPGEVRVLHRPGPLPIRPAEICQAIKQWSH